MNIFLALVLVLLVVALLGLALWSLFRAVKGDGLGHRPVPRSHVNEIDPRPWVAMYPRSQT
jgi:hypothetical protein